MVAFVNFFNKREMMIIIIIIIVVVVIIIIIMIITSSIISIKPERENVVASLSSPMIQNLDWKCSVRYWSFYGNFSL